MSRRCRNGVLLHVGDWLSGRRPLTRTRGATGCTAARCCCRYRERTRTRTHTPHPTPHTPHLDQPTAELLSPYSFRLTRMIDYSNLQVTSSFSLDSRLLYMILQQKRCLYSYHLFQNILESSLNIQPIKCSAKFVILLRGPCHH